jgi:hypothetical protein
MNQSVLEKFPLGFQWQTLDPFLFCVHHVDLYPKANGKFGPLASLEGRNIGQDFEGIQGWRMYHGTKTPGFPVHPHRGFETVTIVREGLVDHADSAGASGRYSSGDVQWMTAGSGLQHSEMFPLMNTDSENRTELFQIWINLPAKNKMVSPDFKMLWKEKIPKLSLNENKVNLEIISGSYSNTDSLEPPKNSWAFTKDNEVCIWLIHMDKESNFILPKSKGFTNRILYIYEGEIKIENHEYSTKTGLLLNHEFDIEIISSEKTKLLFLQGKPINEPVVQYGPFVMNTKEEIQKAFYDYQTTNFGGWNWQSTEPVHQLENRFAIYPNGKKDIP